MKTKLSFVLILLSCFLSNSCKQIYQVELPPATTGIQGKPEVKINGTPEISDKVLVVTDEASGNIKEFTANRLVLSSLEGIKAVGGKNRGLRVGADVSEIKVGDILVYGSEKDIEKSFLIRVVDVVKDGSDVLIDYAEAQMNELFKNVDISINFPTIDAPTIPLDAKLDMGGLEEIGNTKRSTLIRVESKGNAKFSYIPSLAFKIQDYSLEKFSYLLEEQKKINLDVAVGLARKVEVTPFKRRIDLLRPPFIPFVVPVGPIPLVMKFTIVPYARYEADWTALNLETQVVNYESTKTFGFNYDKGQAVQFVNKTIAEKDAPITYKAFSMKGELKAAIGLDFNMSFFAQNLFKKEEDYNGIGLKGEIYGKLSAECNTIKGLNTKVLLGADLLFYTFFESPFSIINTEIPLGKLEEKVHDVTLNIPFCEVDSTPVSTDPIDNFTTPQSPAISASDPHIKTLDSYRYSFMAVGEFIALKSTTDNFQIQVRQEEVKSFNSEGVTSFNTGIAINTGNDILCIYPNNRLFVNRVPVPLNFKDYPLKNNWSVQNRNNELIVRNISGDEVQIKFFNGSNLDYYVTLSENRKGKVRGFLGNYDGSSTNDLFRGDNNQRVVDATFNNLYPAYSDSWRIKQAESLFVYETGKNTDSYTDKNFPRKPITISASERAAAERTCRNAGVTDPFALENCIIDVHLTGRHELAERAVDYEQAGSSLNAFSIGKFQSTDVQLDYFGSTVVDNAVVLNTSQEGFARVNMKQGVNIRNGFTTEFLFNTEDFNEQSCFFLAMWPTNPAQRSNSDSRIGICFGFENAVPITFISYSGFSGGVAGKAVIPNFTDRNIHKVRIVETPQQGGKYRLQVYFDDMNSPKMSIFNDESIENLIKAQRKTGFIEFQINRSSPSIVRVFNWSFKSL